MDNDGFLSHGGTPESSSKSLDCYSIETHGDG